MHRVSVIVSAWLTSHSSGPRDARPLNSSVSATRIQNPKQQPSVSVCQNIPLHGMFWVRPTKPAKARFAVGDSGWSDWQWFVVLAGHKLGKFVIVVIGFFVVAFFGRSCLWQSIYWLSYRLFRVKMCGHFSILAVVAQFWRVGR